MYFKWTLIWFVCFQEGAFFFIENVFGKIGDKARVVQRVLAPFYPFLFDGIKLMVNTDEVITNCGFSKVDFKRIEFEPPIPLLFPLRSAICGSATKWSRWCVEALRSIMLRHSWPTFMSAQEERPGGNFSCQGHGRGQGQGRRLSLMSLNPDTC